MCTHDEVKPIWMLAIWSPHTIRKLVCVYSKKVLLLTQHKACDCIDMFTVWSPAWTTRSTIRKIDNIATKMITSAANSCSRHASNPMMKDLNTTEGISYYFPNTQRRRLICKPSDCDCSTWRVREGACTPHPTNRHPKCIHEVKNIRPGDCRSCRSRISIRTLGVSN